MHIQQVSGREIAKFVDFPYRLYNRHPVWVPPLRLDIRSQLSARKNPFFKHAEGACFLAIDNGRTVGRIAAFHNRKHNRVYGLNVGMFGYLEMVDDQAVTAALLEAASAWLSPLGATRLLGPFNPDINGSMGILLDAFDSPPMILMPYNLPYYAPRLEAAGMQKEKDVLAWEMSIPGTAPERLVRLVDKVLARGRFTVRKAIMRQFDNEVGIIREIYNAAWAENWGALPMDEAEFDHLAKDLKLLVDPDLLHIAEVDGQPAGFCLTLPNINEALARLGNGRLFPLGLLKLLWYKRRIRSLRVITMGVLEPYRRLGIDAVFYLRTIRQAQAKGYLHGEMSWILEDNTLMNHALLKAGAKPAKTYRVYGMPLDGVKVTDAAGNGSLDG